MLPKQDWFGLFPVRSPLLRESRLFSFPVTTKMFQFITYASLLMHVILSLQLSGLSHSEIPGSKVICTLPGLIAAYHVLHRLREPRHPPVALLLLFFCLNYTSSFCSTLGNAFGPTSWLYLIIFMLLLVAFAYFYVLISFNPVEVANNIKNNGGAIPGIRSGRPTIEFVKKVLYRVTLVGALLIVLIACLPMVINDVCNLDVIKNAINARGIGFGLAEGSTALENYQALYTGLFSTLAFGGSSLMIVVGVALETTRELEAQMSLRNYKGFLD